VGGDTKGAADVTIEEQEAAELEKLKAEQEAAGRAFKQAPDDMSRGASESELHIESHSSTPPSPGFGAFIKAQQARASAAEAHAMDEVVEEVLSSESRALVEDALQYRERQYRESRQAAAAGAVMEEVITDLVAQECWELVREEVNNAATVVAQGVVAQEMIEAVLFEDCQACAQDATQAEVLRRENQDVAATLVAQEMIEALVAEECHAQAKEECQAKERAEACRRAGEEDDERDEEDLSKANTRNREEEGEEEEEEGGQGEEEGKEEDEEEEMRRQQEQCIMMRRMVAR